MNIKIQSISILFVIIFLHSCTKDADIKLPTVEQKLVVHSFISPQDKNIQVKVTLSQPIFNNSNSQSYSSVSNANVQMSDGAITQTLSYDSSVEAYLLSSTLLPIVEGKTYHLYVTTPDGKSATASTYIPAINTSLQASIEPVISNNSNNFATANYIVKSSWNDLSGQKNYYKIISGDRYYDGIIIDSTFSIHDFSYTDDSNLDGQTIVKEVYVYPVSNPTISKYELILYHVTPEFYKYHISLQNYYNSGGPFAEPVQIFSNIEGGLGVFAGFNAYQITLNP